MRNGDPLLKEPYLILKTGYYKENMQRLNLCVLLIRVLNCKLAPTFSPSIKRCFSVRFRISSGTSISLLDS